MNFGQRLQRLLRRLLRRSFVVAGMVVLAATTATSAGCAHRPPIEPWQREHLAKRAMRFDSDPVEMHFRQHAFGAREGSDLGYGQPGGGCGCN
jgi:hypothetical protein